MKKAFLSIIPVIILVIGCAGGAKSTPDGPAANAGLLTLDQALKEAADRIDERIPVKSKIAPLNFNSLHDKFSGYVLDELTANLVDSRKLTVVDRKEVDLIRSEFDFQYSGEVDDNSMQELGRLLGAQTIISGSLTDMGGFYRIVIRVLNVQSASVEVQYRANIENNAIMTALLTGGRSYRAASVPQRTTTSSGNVTAPAAATQAAPSAVKQTAPVAAPVIQTQAQATVPTPIQTPPPAVNYDIGGTGPAGGLIFYDKGNSSGGWRYLEAAPASTETKIRWGTLGTDAGGKKTGIGDGKENTQSVLAAMNQLGESAPAVQYCVNMNFGGFRDWFLPSKAELNLMFSNLKMNGLGGFKNEWYWSSSEENTSRSWRQSFNDGSQGTNYNNKDDTYIVRAVRRF